jgi:riboflavin kinase / FMN adenylyltransferase
VTDGTTPTSSTSSSTSGGPHVVHDLEDIDPAPSAVTIGNFDGVHRGHQILLQRAVEAAEDRGVRSVAVTFHPHPAAVLRPGTEPPALQTLDDRLAHLLAAGIDLVLVLRFTEQLASLGPHVFVQQVLVERIRAVEVVVGSNFRFGHKASGNVVTLNDAGAAYGFRTEAVSLLDLHGVPLSSTNIREHLESGEVEWANAALGRAFSLVGEVVVGEGRGRTIGIPTANVAVPEGVLVPANGVYAGHAEVDGVRYPSVTNVGQRPTFDGRGRTVEVHLLDADVDLYGRELRVCFEHRLRDERRFTDADELVGQIRADIVEARRLLAA